MTRMTIEWFNSPEEQSIEVPWLKDFVVAGGDYDRPIPVDCCINTPKGVLILTCDYKGFVFKGSQLFRDLLEALEEYVDPKYTFPKLVSSGTEEGKILLGLDHDDQTATWRKESNKYFQRYDDPKFAREKELSRKRNPLLPNPPSQNGVAASLPADKTPKKKST